MQQYVDEVTLPLVTGVEQNALLALTQLAAVRSRLDATLLYVGTGPRRPTGWCSGSPRPIGSGGSIRAPATWTAAPVAPGRPRATTSGLRPDALGTSLPPVDAPSCWTDLTHAGQHGAHDGS